MNNVLKVLTVDEGLVSPDLQAPAVKGLLLLIFCRRPGALFSQILTIKGAGSGWSNLESESGPLTSEADSR